MPYAMTANVAMFEGGDWSGYRKTISGCSPEQARRIATLDPELDFFFFCREPMVLTNPGWPQPRIFQPGDAVFFAGEPWWGSAPQCDGYVKNGLSIAYAGSLGSSSPLVAAQFVTSQGLNAVDMVSLFAANLNTSLFDDLIRLAPDVPVPAGGTLATAHDYYLPVFEECVAKLQAQGIAVLLTFLNNHDSSGWSEFATPTDASNFAAQLQYVVDTYGFDGIDIDDEYSKGPAQPNSLAMVTTLIRQQMPQTLLSKALWADLDTFDERYEGSGLAQTLSCGWEMSYGNDPQGALPPYVAKGMAPRSLAYGFQAPSGDPTGSIAWLKENGYAGFMVYDFENPANQDLMGTLVDLWCGPGNWNPASEGEAAG